MKKLSFQSTLARARRIKGTPHFKAKNIMADVAAHKLSLDGWRVEGHCRYPKGNEVFGLVKDGDHITVSDIGSNPWNLGDTEIRVSFPMTTYYDAPIELR